jgi:hypothetical protein
MQKYKKSVPFHHTFYSLEVIVNNQKNGNERHQYFSFRTKYCKISVLARSQQADSATFMQTLLGLFHTEDVGENMFRYFNII